MKRAGRRALGGRAGGALAQVGGELAGYGDEGDVEAAEALELGLANGLGLLRSRLVRATAERWPGFVWQRERCCWGGIPIGYPEFWPEQQSNLTPRRTR